MAATAQDAYRQMLREHIAPELQELGFRRGPSPGAFRCESGKHAAEVRFLKSRGSTRQEVSFWVDLHASWTKTEWVYWEWTLCSLAREPLWELQAEGPAEPVASEVLRVFRRYGWPAIQAALDNPGYPPDPAVHWAGTFPKIPRGPMFDDEIAAAWRSRANLSCCRDGQNIYLRRSRSANAWLRTRGLLDRPVRGTRGRYPGRHTMTRSVVPGEATSSASQPEVRLCSDDVPCAVSAFPGDLARLPRAGSGDCVR